MVSRYQDRGAHRLPLPNVFRPYVVKLIESGKLPAQLVGTRRRVSFTDLVKFDEEDRKARRAVRYDSPDSGEVGTLM